MNSKTKGQSNISRRQFAKVSGIATVGTLMSTSPVWASNSNTLKVGLIGCGGRGTGAGVRAASVPGAGASSFHPAPRAPDSQR